jgi:hypothetical protein
LRRDVEMVIQCARQTLEVAQAEGWHRPILDSIVEVLENRGTRLAAIPARA